MGRFFVVGPCVANVPMQVLHIFKTSCVILLVQLLLLMTWQPRRMLTWRLKLFLCVSLHVLGAGDIIYLVVLFCLKSKTLTWHQKICTSPTVLHTVGMLTRKPHMGTLPHLLTGN